MQLKSQLNDLMSYFNSVKETQRKNFQEIEEKVSKLETN